MNLIDSNEEHGPTSTFAVFTPCFSVTLCRGSIFQRREEETAEFSQRDSLRRGGQNVPANKLLMGEVIFHLTLHQLVNIESYFSSPQGEVDEMFRLINC